MEALLAVTQALLPPPDAPTEHLEKFLAKTKVLLHPGNHQVTDTKRTLSRHVGEGTASRDGSVVYLPRLEQLWAGMERKADLCRELLASQTGHLTQCRGLDSWHLYLAMDALCRARGQETRQERQELRSLLITVVVCLRPEEGEDCEAGRAGRRAREALVARGERVHIGDQGLVEEVWASVNNESKQSSEQKANC